MNLIFTKNRFPLHLGNGEMAFDCHYHSSHSDGYSGIAKILRQAKERNLGIAITDHNEIAGVLEGYNNTLGVSVIPGIEVSCSGRIHLLIYFYELGDLKDFFEKYVEPYRRVDHNTFLKKMTALKIAKVAKQYKCLVFLAHPYSTGHRQIESYMSIKGTEKFFMYLDGVEVLNGTLQERNNLKAYRLAQELKKPVIGGSDGHVLSVLGKTVTVAKAHDYRSFLDEVRQNRVRLLGNTANFYQQSKMMGVLSYRHLSAATKKHHTNMAAALGLMAVFQRFSVPLLYFLGATAYKKVKERRKSVRR